MLSVVLAHDKKYEMKAVEYKYLVVSRLNNFRRITKVIEGPAVRGEWARRTHGWDSVQLRLK